MNVLITGASGFIGINLANFFLEKGHNVIGIDNFLIKSSKNLKLVENKSGFIFINSSINNVDYINDRLENIKSKIGEIESVWHLAANSDIASGILNPDIDYENTFFTTHNLLKIMKINQIKKIYFASTSAIYGDFGNIPVNENSTPLNPISYYGAMKLASECAISAARELFLEKAILFRFPNVVGFPSTHGIIFDFINKLKNSDILEVLGNGTQEKIYLHVSELIEAMNFLSNQNLNEKLSVFNIGPKGDSASVSFIAEEVVKLFKPNAKIIYGSENRGWVGDVPKFTYDTSKLNNLGWKSKLTSKEAIRLAIHENIKITE